MAKKNRIKQLQRLRGNKDPRGEALTKKEAAFVEAFTGPAQGDAVRAAQMAGYATSSVGLIKVATPQVRREIDRRMAEMEELGGALSPLEIHSIWRRLSKHPDPQVALRATENAAKVHGMFITRSEQSINVNHNNSVIGDPLDRFLAELEPEELEAFIEIVRMKREKMKAIDVEVVEVDDGGTSRV